MRGAVSLTHPPVPLSASVSLGGPWGPGGGGLGGGGPRGRQGPPQREGWPCPGQALECGWVLEGETHKEVLYAPP